MLLKMAGLKVCTPGEKENASKGSQSAQIFCRFLSHAVLEAKGPWGQRPVGAQKLSGALGTLVGQRAKVTFKAGKAAGLGGPKKIQRGEPNIGGCPP